jgi:hypothetical protein
MLFHPKPLIIPTKESVSEPRGPLKEIKTLSRFWRFVYGKFVSSHLQRYNGSIALDWLENERACT